MPVLALAAALGPGGLALRWPAPTTALLVVVLAPLLEEIVFRAGVQDALAARSSARLGPLTRANALTAAAFALFHLARHPVGWAAATCVPALVFGYFYERHGRTLAAPIGLHAGYNAVWLVLLGPG